MPLMDRTALTALLRGPEPLFRLPPGDTLRERCVSMAARLWEVAEFVFYTDTSHRRTYRTSRGALERCMRLAESGDWEEIAPPMSLRPVSDREVPTRRIGPLGMLPRGRSHRRLVRRRVDWLSEGTSLHPSEEPAHFWYWAPARGARTCVVLLHAWTRGAYWWEEGLAARLARQGVACAVPELPEHAGRSLRGDFNGAGMVCGDLVRSTGSMLRSVAEARTIARHLRAEHDTVGFYGLSIAGWLSHLSACGGFGDFSASFMSGDDPAGQLMSSPITHTAARDLRDQGLDVRDVRRAWSMAHSRRVSSALSGRPALVQGATGDTLIESAAVRRLAEDLGTTVRWHPVAHLSAWFGAHRAVDEVAELARAVGAGRGRLVQPAAADPAASSGSA